MAFAGPSFPVAGNHCVHLVSARAALYCVMAEVENIILIMEARPRYTTYTLPDLP